MKKKSASALAFFNPCALTAHQKQSGTRSFRMPASLGILLCAAGLLAVPGKTFSQVPQGVFSVTETGRQESSDAPDAPAKRRTPTPTPSPTPTSTRTPRPTPTPTATRTPPPPPTATETSPRPATAPATATATFTPTPTATATATATAAPTATPTPTATAVARALHGVIDLISSGDEV